MKKVVLNKLKEYSPMMKESLRALKTNIQFCGDDIQVIMVTSCTPNEGKSTVCLDLARSLTESGMSVLVIDTDMRKSVLAARLRAKTADDSKLLGLSHYLSGQNKLSEVIYATNIAKLYMLFSGPSVPNPTEILDKKYFAELIEVAKTNFDYIIIDTPPLGAAIDAAVVAKYVDGAIMVVSQEQISKRVFAGAIKQLESSGVKILGAVLNKVKMKRSNYGNYYGNYYGKY